MEFHKINRYYVGARQVGKALEFHLNLASRLSRSLPAVYRFKNIIPISGYYEQNLFLEDYPKV
jgi:hypothetical protein